MPPRLPDTAITWPASRFTRPPGLRVEDFPTWRSWLATHHAEYTTITYDVPLLVAGVPLYEDTPTGRGFQRSNAYRIDAAALLPDERVDLIEINRSPDAGALGQLLVYAYLWPELYAHPIRSRILVARDPREDLDRAARALGVRIDIA